MNLLMNTVLSYFMGFFTLIPLLVKFNFPSYITLFYVLSVSTILDYSLIFYGGLPVPMFWPDI